MTQHYSTSSFFVFSKDLNYGETLFGGKLMAEIDCEAAKVARSLIYDTDADNVVTASIERVDFKAPARRGDLVLMEADVKELGRTSIKINVKVWIKRGIDRKNWVDICEAHTTFVSLKDGSSFPHNKTMDKLQNEV